MWRRSPSPKKREKIGNVAKQDEGELRPMTVEELEAEELLELPDRTVPSILDVSGGVAPFVDAHFLDEVVNHCEEGSAPSSPNLPGDNDK